MGYGEVWWFLRDDGVVSLDEAVTALRDAGLVAGNPATGVPQILDNGRQVTWDAAEVGRRWAAGETVTAQLWVNRETDVLVEMMRQHQLLTFDLDGMTTAEARFTVFAVLNAAFSVVGTRAVVGDKDLLDFGDDLLAAMAEGSLTAGLPFPPDLLASVVDVGHYNLEIRAGSWLSKPAANVQSFT